ncbi:MAG: recombination protein RecR [Clostridiales bacterium]|nr:recombination protein RecR [Clostridiales bacterium]
MASFAAPVERLIEQFESLPGIGHKTAQRLAFYIISASDERAQSFAQAILEAKQLVTKCKICCNLSENEECVICSDDGRDRAIVCVVSDPKDVAAFERSREYNGVYHVLHGVISPMNYIGPDDLCIRELVSRVTGGGIEEVILATNPDTEGEATAMYISRILKPFEVKVSRLAYGIPVGGRLEYADEVTLQKALDGRTEML